MSWDDIALAHGTDKASNGHGYMEHYERILGARLMLFVCEVGVWKGASLRTWADILPEAQIVGFDIEEREHEPWPDNVEVLIGDGPTRLSEWCAVDVIIDDGSHRIEDTVRTIAAARTALAPDGVLVIEDVAIDDAGPDLHCLLDVVTALRSNGFTPFCVERSRTGHHAKGDLLILFAERA